MVSRAKESNHCKSSWCDMLKHGKNDACVGRNNDGTEKMMCECRKKWGCSVLRMSDSPDVLNDS